jgi:hypothetical protein
MLSAFDSIWTGELLKTWAGSGSDVECRREKKEGASRMDPLPVFGNQVITGVLG